MVIGKSSLLMERGAHTMPEFAYIIIADGVVDQVCETEEEAFEVTAKLRRMEYNTRIKTVAWEEQDAVIASLS